MKAKATKTLGWDGAFPPFPVLWIVGSLVLSFLLMTARARAQEGSGVDDAQALIERIRQGMHEIDKNLADASAAGVREKLAENVRYMEELINNTRGQSRDVINSLDELIRSIKYKKCSSGGGGMPPPPDPSEKEKQKQQPRSETEDKELKKNPANQNEEGEPEDARPEEAKGQKNRAKEPPNEKPPEEVDHPDVSGRWGVLPPKIQNDILNFNIENFPEKYRKWLEEYYKRINQRKRR